ncbi:MAG: acyltransferase [Candidatus Hydrogenedentes bacterium]|nr:acyltransferase [Candidatus Hydrogenedentota bacterium]
MRLPGPLVVFRSRLAALLGWPLRVAAPLRLRLARFLYEIWGRGQIRGRVEAGAQFIGVITVEGTRNVHIGAGTRVGRRTYLKTDGAGRIEIGRHVTINDGATIVAYQEVRIGDNTMIGEYVTIRDQNHGSRRGELVRSQPYDVAPVSIGSDAWLGRGVCVLRGVTVGDGAVVGANAVVTKDVSPYAVVGGVPARPLGVRKP